MKTILHSITLISITALVLVTGAETLEVFVATSLAYVLPFIGFIASLLLLTFREDYARNKNHFEPRRAEVILLPASEAFRASVDQAPTTIPSWTARHRRIRRAVLQS